MPALTDTERRTLAYLRPHPAPSWVRRSEAWSAAALDSLTRRGLAVVRGHYYWITEAGRKALEEKCPN